MDQNPIKTAGRAARRKEYLGGGEGMCLLCGYSKPEALIPVTEEWLEAHGIPRRILEEHHVATRNRDGQLVALLCRNCHTEATEGLLRAGVSMRAERDPRARVAAMLDALAVFLGMLAEAVRRWAEILRRVLTPEDPNV